MRKFSFFLLVAATTAISLAFWAIIIALIAWGVSFLTGDLHSSGITSVPALSFWQSVKLIILIYLLAIPLRAGRINISKEGKGER
mgnify:CR=1 FL=1